MHLPFKLKGFKGQCLIGHRWMKVTLVTHVYGYCACLSITDFLTDRQRMSYDLGNRRCCLFEKALGSSWGPSRAENRSRQPTSLTFGERLFQLARCEKPFSVWLVGKCSRHMMSLQQDGSLKASCLSLCLMLIGMSTGTLEV